MLLLDRQQVADSPTSEAMRALRLRQRADGKTVDLPRGKTTIGSSPRCNLRIQQPGVQPLHCLIVHDEGGLTVRRWAGETLLNGRLLEESPLSAGDCLKVGPIELEVVAPQAETAPAKPAAVLAVPVGIVANDVSTARIQAGRDAARKRAKKLVAELRRGRDGQRELSQRVAGLEQQIERALTERQSLADELQKATAELASARTHTMEQQSLVVAGQGLAAENEQLMLEVGELTQRVDKFTREQAASAAAYQALVQQEAALAEEVRRLVEEKDRLEEDHAEFTSKHAVIGDERDEFRRHNEQLQDRIRTLTEERTELAEERSASARQRDELSRQITQLLQEKESLSEQASALSNEQMFLFGERDELLAKNEQLEANANGLAAEKAALAEDRSAVGIELDEQRRSHEQLEAEMHTLAEQKSKLENEQAVLCGERDGFRRQLERLQKKLDVLTGERANLADERTALADEMAAVCVERDELQEQNERLQVELHTLTEQKSTIANEHSATCGERNELRQQREQLNRELNAVKREKAELVGLKDLAFGERDELRQKVEQLQAEMQKLAHERSELADEQAVLCGERDGFRKQLQRLDTNLRELDGEKKSLSDMHAKVCGERDELRRQAEKLQAEMQVLAEQRTTLADERQGLTGEREQLRRQNHELQANVDVLTAEKAALADERANLTGERDRLLQETGRIDELEQQVSEAVANRENTSSELYRALLQLAEMQERDEHFGTLQADHVALNEELEKSAAEVARLQEQLEQLAGERAEADNFREELAQKSAELDESQQRLATENADLHERLTGARNQLEEAVRQQGEYAARLQLADAMRQQLEVSEHSLAELGQTVARLESELAARDEAEAEVSATATDHQRTVVEQARQIEKHVETIARLQEQLATGVDARTALNEARHEWETIHAEATQREENQSHRIADLEAALAESQAATSAAESRFAEALAAARELSVSKAAAEPVAAEFDWSSARRESRPVDVPSTAHAEPTPGGWGFASQEEESSFESESEPAGDFSADSWAAEKGAEAPEVDAESNWQEAKSPENVFLPESSAPSESSPAGYQFAPPARSDEVTSKEDASSVSNAAQPASFIERYSHMFAEEESRGGAAGGPLPSVPSERRPMETATPRNPAPPGIGASNIGAPSPAVADEESIEQYMAKLLQRVRGDSQDSTIASQAPVRGTTNSGPLGYTPPSPMQMSPTSLRDPLASISTSAGADSGRRKTSVPAPQTDLEALRALANETARRAISRHSLRKHRRNAVTKLIVSTLAGVTSLWMMLEASSWLSLQFITGCLTMLVAAYWAGETFRTMLESFRVAADDEQQEEELNEFKAQLIAPLPIDLDNVGRWDKREPIVEGPSAVVESSEPDVDSAESEGGAEEIA